MNSTFIVRFNDIVDRNKFCETLRTTKNLAAKRIDFGEFLPDIIVHDITKRELEMVSRLSRVKARLIPDFQHDLFAAREP